MVKKCRSFFVIWIRNAADALLRYRVIKVDLKFDSSGCFLFDQ